MHAQELLSRGDLREALTQLQQQVRKDPANAKQRIFLSQLLALLGEWERSLNQLNVLGDLDAGALAMVQMYREALRCEKLRAQIFAGQGSPLVFGEPQRWIALLVEALRLSGQGDYAGAKPLRDEAYDLAPATSGTIDGQTFEWIADADMRLGPVLEAIVNGGYYWVPFDRIKEIRIEEPTDLRDLVWLPVQLIWSNGGGTVGLIPTRYPGSEASPDPLIQMSRKTEWLEPEPGLYLGSGQRMLSTDGDEYSLMDVRLIALDTTAEEDAAAEPQDVSAVEGADG